MNVKKIVKIIKNGGVIISPTDTIYGLICDATNKKAVEKIFKIKKRPRIKPLPIFIKDIKMAKKLAYIDEPASAKGFGEARQEKILKKYWPGEFTFVLNKKKGVKVYGVNKNTIALRLPKYRFLNVLLRKINKPLAQTSANISGKPASTKIKEVLTQFAKNKIKPDLIIDVGNLPKNRPSKVIDLTKNRKKVLRY